MTKPTAQARVIFRRRVSPFVKKFDSTPEGVVCPHFHVLSHANGCLYNCSYCYLKHTMRNTLENNKPIPTVFTNISEMKEQVRKWAAKTPKAMLNAGELSDSFLDPRYLDMMLKGIVQDKHFESHTMLLVTKGAANVVEVLRNYEPQDNVIVSFSASPNAANYENGAPHVAKRLIAAKKIRDMGWRIRLRLDPIIPEDLGGTPSPMNFMEACAGVGAERITLGSLRFAFGWRYDRKLRAATTESDNCGRYGKAFKMRLPFQERIRLYEDVSAGLRTFGYGGPIGFCKEVVKVYEHFGLNPEQPVCNCSLFEE